MVKLEEMYRRVGFEAITVSEIDDIFYALKKLGIQEVIVNNEQMGMITMWCIANYGDKEYDGWSRARIIREGKIDKFLGIQLVV